MLVMIIISEAISLSNYIILFDVLTSFYKCLFVVCVISTKDVRGPYNSLHLNIMSETWEQKTKSSMLLSYVQLPLCNYNL